MSAISAMELNTKSPILWDWDNLVAFPPRSVDMPKKLQPVDSESEAVNGFEIGSFHSSGGRSDDRSGGSASNLAYGSLSKSSKSGSIDSSTNRDMSDCFSQDLSNQKELARAWPTSTPSMASGDFFIGLKLGKRTYFEAVCGGNNGKTSAPAPAPAPCYTTGKRSKLLYQSTEIPRCQVEGCNLDLSSAKDYHRKHRVCESHSKSPKVIICGLERRFCQQCSRFHALSEFDHKNRSCRRRLSEHNARRRKPKPEIIQFGSMRLPSSLHEGRNQIRLAPTVQTRPNSNATWDFSSNSKLTQEKFSLFSPTETEGVDLLQVTQNEPQETGFKLSYGSTQLPSSMSATAEIFHQGFQVSTTNNTAQDLDALSLLSRNSWGSREPPLDHSNRLRHHTTRPPVYGQGEEQSVSSGLQRPTIQKNGSDDHFQEFQFKAQNQPSFYSFEHLR